MDERRDVMNDLFWYVIVGVQFVLILGQMILNEQWRRLSRDQNDFIEELVKLVRGGKS